MGSYRSDIQLCGGWVMGNGSEHLRAQVAGPPHAAPDSPYNVNFVLYPRSIHMLGNRAPW